MERKIFHIDLRALAVFRMGLAAVLILDLFQRSPDLESHYTDFGLLNRSAALQVLPDNAFSLHLAGGSLLFQIILFLFAFIFACSYLVGYRTRLSGLVSWVLLISLQNRNPLILNNADTLLLACLFWSLFLPTQSRYSIDAVSSTSTLKENNFHFSIAGVALLIQVMSLYLFSFFHKTGVEWYPEGTALYYALHVGAYVTPFGVWFRQSPFILTGMTYGTLILQLLGPFLMFTPVFRLPLRLLMISLFAFFHLGILALMDLGFFPIIGLVALIPFIPEECWDLLERKLRHSPRQAPDNSSTETGSFHLIKNNRVTHIFVGAMLALVLLWNSAGLPQTGFQLPSFVGDILRLVRMNQQWKMFSPFPYKISGWYAIPGELRNGQPVDVYWKKPGKASFERPEYISKTFKNERWRKYLTRMRLDNNNEAHLLNFGRFLCRSWNRDTPFNEQLYTFQIHFLSEETQLNYQKPKTDNWVLWNHDCFAPD